MTTQTIDLFDKGDHKVATVNVSWPWPGIPPLINWNRRFYVRRGDRYVEEAVACAMDLDTVAVYVGTNEFVAK